MALPQDPHRPSPVPVGGLRKLVGLEEAMRITDDAAPFSVVSVFRLAGSLPVPALRAALDELQQRHPLLRARIVPEGKAHAYLFDAAGPIPLEVADRDGADHWMRVVEEELAHRIDFATGPLIRCRYLVDGGGGDLVIAIPHNIVDATSAAPLFRELLALCAGRAPAGTTDITAEGRTPAPALYPKGYTGAGLALAAAAQMGRQMVDEMQFRWNSRGVRTAPIHPIAVGHCRVLPIKFSAPASEALVQASRQHRITLNSMLSAAMLSAVQRNLYPSPRVPLRHIIFSDLRSRLSRSVPDDMLGCFLTMFRLTVNVERDGAFWDLARQVQEKTVRAARSGERFVAYSMAPGMMKMIFGLKAFRMAATAVSYAGALDMSVSGGPFDVTGVHAFAANMTLGPELSGLARLFRGELYWDLLYLDSDMDAAGAQTIAGQIRTILESATS